MNKSNPYHLPARGFTATDNRGAHRHRGWPPPQPSGLKKVGLTQDAFAVFDRPSSHHHLGSELLAEALGRITLDGRPFVKERVDFGRIIGTTDCVATTAQDRISFSQRDGRAGPTRFVHNREPEPWTGVIIILKRMSGDEGYLLITAFVGTAAEPEPWDRNATPAAFDFWSNHALVWGSCQVVPGTETTRCPWTAPTPPPDSDRHPAYRDQPASCAAISTPTGVPFHQEEQP